jgi:hypothetical protein
MLFEQLPIVFKNPGQQNNRGSQSLQFIQFRSSIYQTMELQDDQIGFVNDLPIKHGNCVEYTDKALDLKSVFDKQGPDIGPVPVIVVDEPYYRRVLCIHVFQSP